MSPDSFDKLAWINHWLRIGPVLRAQARIELQNLTQAQRQQQIANLLDLAMRFQKPRSDQGLVILQKKFAEMFTQ